MKPNILLIHDDQHRGDCLGLENHPVLETPTLDSLGHRGTHFNRFYSACPSCIASRRSLLFGQSPQRHGVVGFQGGIPVPDEVLSLPEILRQNGYQTALVGRNMHQSPSRKSYGFEEMEIVTSPHHGVFSEYHEWVEKICPELQSDARFSGGVMHNDWTAAPWSHPEHMHPTNWTVDRALRFFKRRDPTRPYFLSVGFIAPHPPFNPPAFYMERYLRTGVPDPVIGDWAVKPDPRGMQDSVAPDQVALSPEAALSARAAYYGSINHVDVQLRRLLNPILGVTGDPNLIVIFTSDHGEMLGDHYGWRKSRAYESCARVPLLMSIPDSMGGQKGTVCDAPVTHADIMPTLLDLLDLPIPKTVDGDSFAAELRGVSETPKRPPIHIEHAPYHHALTDGRQKFIWDPKNGEEQFFDLEKDPEERRNVVKDAAYAESVAGWRRQLVERLRDRPEGFVSNDALVAGRPWSPVIPGGQSDLKGV